MGVEVRRNLKLDPLARGTMFRRYLLTHETRTPTPEKMFEYLIRKGWARIERRPFKQPRLVWL